MNKLKLFLTTMCILSTPISFAKSNAPWPTYVVPGAVNANPFFYYFDHDTLRTALIKVAQSFEVKVHFSEDIPDDLLNKPLSGRFKVYSPVELFNQYGNKFGFSWFFYSGILYITPDSFVTKNLYVAPEVMANFKSMLSNDGLLDEKFGWTEVPAEGMVVISGPQDYVNLIVKKMKKLNISPVDQQFAVFRLKYANAVDTSIDINNSQIVIPGVATILRTMLQGNKNTVSGVDNKLLQQVVEPLKNNLKAILPNSNLAQDSNQADNNNNSSQGGDNSTASDSRTKASLTSPVIQADQRLNTIIIRDKSSNIAIYKALIDMIDVPAPLIQIEVLILDIDQVKMNSAGISWWGNTGGNGKAANSVNGGFGSNTLGTMTQNGAPTLMASYGNVTPGNLIVSNMASFLAGLRFLENKGFAKAESKSAVVTIDNIAALVNLTESFYTVNATQSQQGSAISTQMQMQVVPHVIYDDGDKKRIKLIVSLKDGNVEEKTVNGLPATLQGHLNSQAIIEEGSSLLLAGFTHKKMEQIESKVPLLGDIPVLGWLFKDKSTSSRQYQRSYLVSPRIIWSDRNVKIPNYTILDRPKKSNSRSKQNDQD